MKAAIALISVLVLSALVLLGLSRLLPSSDGNGVAQLAVDESATALADGTAGEGSVPAPVAAPEAELKGAAEGRSADQAPAAKGDPTEESWDPTASVWLRGSVEVSGSCVRDDLLVAYALARAAEVDDLEAALTSEEHPASDGEGEGKSEDTRLVLSRRPVAADGTFELPLPPDARQVHAIVIGRYLYMPSSRPVDLGTGAKVVLAPRCGGSLEGRVQVSRPEASRGEGDEIELALAAKIEGALSAESGYGRKAHAEKDGSFVIHAVPSGRAFTLDADDERFAPRRLKVEPLSPGETRRVELSLVPGANVHGRVVDESGAPVAGAEVVAAVKKVLSRDFGTRTGATDAEGRFSLAGLAPESVSFQGKLAGYRDSESVILDLAEGEERSGVELILDRGLSISGRLRWSDGSPAASVEVSAKFDPAQMFGMGGLGSNRGGDGKGETDAEGRFRITGLASGKFDLSAKEHPPAALAESFLASLGVEQTTPEGPGSEAEGAGSEDAGQRRSRIFDADWVAHVEAVKAGAEGLELVLQPPRGVAGRVVDERDEPIASFRIRAVQFTETPLGPMARDEDEESFEDEGGRFYYSGLIDGTWNFYTLAEGFSAGDPVPVTLPDQEREELVLRVLRSASVSGTVHAPSGTPVSGATVSVDTGSPFWTSEISGAPEPPSVVSGADGTFALDDLAPGNVTLAVSAEGYARGVGEPLELAPGQRASGADLYLREGGVVTGEVYGSDGERAAGRVVQAVRMQNYAIHFTDTDGEGAFRIEHMEAGSWQIQSLPGQQTLSSLDRGDEESMNDLITEMQTAVVEVKDGETSHVVLGAPPADPIEVRGRATLHGEPYAGAAVVFYSEGKDMMQKMRRVLTSDSGEFTLTLDGPGNYVAAVQKFSGDFMQQSTIEFQVEIPAVAEHELELALPIGRISGRLRAEGTGPVVGERVTLYPAEPASSGSLWGGQYSEVQSDEEGSYDLNGLRSGRYSLAVGGMPAGGLFGTAARFGRIVRDVDVEDGEWVQGLDFRLEAAAKAHVRVLDSAGKPVAGAAIFVRDESGHVVELFSVTSTDPQGVCEYGGLAPGRYSFCARKDGFASEETGLLRIEHGEPAEVQLMLQEGTILWVKLLDGEGKGVQASISVLDDDGRQVGTMVALDEIFDLLGGEGFSMTERRIGPLPPGEYQVIATTKDGRVERKPVHLKKQSERRLSIHFRD